MMTSVPQEIYLLERYSSAEYFKTLRDAWGAMVEHVEKTLYSFMHNLPLDYRSRPLPEQPDVVWGEQVLPNFRDTFKGLCDGLALLVNNDFRGLSYCNGPLNDFSGQREFWSGWMPEHDLQEYSRLLLESTRIAQNISATEKSHWNPGELSVHFDENSFGSADLPEILPSYRINRRVTVNSGTAVKKSGIYLPDADNSCAEFINNTYGDAPEATIFVGEEIQLHPVTNVPFATDRIYEEVPCTWTLVERDDSKAGSPTLVPQLTVRVPGGGKCPQSGYYFSPAREKARRWFVDGAIMPDFDSGYGVTIWQLDNIKS